MTEVEPEWDSDTRNWAFALSDLEADACPHGHRLSESMHVDGQPDPEFEVAYEACVQCAAMERAQELQSNADDDDPQLKKRRDADQRTPYDFPSARIWFAKPAKPNN